VKGEFLYTSIGVVSGVPTAKAKSWSLTFEVTGALGGTAQKTLRLTIRY
jgi:hypothetical protein